MQMYILYNKDTYHHYSNIEANSLEEAREYFKRFFRGEFLIRCIQTKERFLVTL